MVVLAGDGISQFFLLIFGWGRTLADASQPKFSQPQRRQTSSDRSKERRRPDSSEECRHQCGILYEAECAAKLNVQS